MHSPAHIPMLKYTRSAAASQPASSSPPCPARCTPVIGDAVLGVLKYGRWPRLKNCVMMPGLLIPSDSIAVVSTVPGAHVWKTW